MEAQKEFKDMTAKEVPAKKEQVKKNHTWQRDKDREPVKGIFRFYEVPGGTLEFTYGPMYKGDKTVNYKLRDGEIHTLPLGVAKHLNKNVCYPVHDHMMDEHGQPSMKIKQMVRRVGFQSLEFIDIDDLSPSGNSIIMVERTAL